MSEHPIEADRNGEVVHLRPEPGTELVAVPAPPETMPEPAVATPVIHADVTEQAGELRPVIPEHLQTVEGIKATVRLHAHRHSHRARYHGVRAPGYLAKTIAYALRGVAVLNRRTLTWWHATGLWIMESAAVAQGRAAHNDALKYHTEGKKTRAKRGRILAACVVLALAALGAMVAFSPWWGWVLFTVALVAFLSRHGKPAGKSIVQPAVIGAQYEKVTPDVIVRALGSLSIATLDKWLREGREIQFVAPGVGRDGPGWRIALDLPFGVTVQEILDKRDKLASGLRRPLGCVWPEPADEHAGRLVLYICDEPLSKARQPAWPLAKAGKADLFGPLPFGTDQRGRAVTILLMFANLLIGSIPRQGKTVAMRLIMLAAALSPITELRVFELKGTGDLEPVAKCCHAYGSGADDDTIKACLDSLRQLHDVELIRRAKTIRGLSKDECPESKVTPELAAKRALKLHPIVFGLDEAQEAFSHPEYGKLFAQLALGVIKRGPALGIMLVLSTQRPDKDSMPTGVSANVAIRFCLKVMGQIENDMILGTSAYKNGIRATLMTRSDKGCGYLVGESDAPQVVKTYNVDGRKAEVIAVRARAMREAAGTLTGYALGEDADSESRSFAADVLTVFGADSKLWTETIAARLADVLSDAYADVTTEAVASQLRALAVTVKKVREPGREPRPGCERSAVEQAAGAVPGA